MTCAVLDSFGPGLVCGAACLSNRAACAGGAGPAEEAVRGLRLQLLAHTLRWAEGYLWQRGRWDLHVAALRPPPWRSAGGGDSGRGAAAEEAGAGAAAAAVAPEAGAQPALWGSVAFGDNVEDEWFVVWLLLELTRTFPITARCAALRCAVPLCCCACRSLACAYCACACAS